MLEKVEELINEAHSGVADNRHENSWNNFVHGPLLKLIFPGRNYRLPPSSDVRVECESVMFAAIAGPWIPTFGKKQDGSVLNLACTLSANTAEDSEGNQVSTDKASLTEIRSRVESKKVDYVLALDLPAGDPLRERALQLAESSAPKIDCANYVNQTIYEPLFENLIAVSIETKARANSKHPAESFVQLSVWVAAWHNRMEHLRIHLLQGNQPSSAAQAADSKAPSNRLVSVPMIEVNQHDWSLYFACDEVDSIRTFGPIKIGSTVSVIEVYKLLNSLEAIKQWVMGTFRRRMGGWFGLDNSHLPPLDEENGTL